MNDSVLNNAPRWVRKYARATVKFLETGLDFLVPLSIILIAILQLYPNTSLRISALDNIADLLGNKVFILPIALYCVSVSVKLFVVARRFPVEHWAFFLGLSSAVSSILVLVLILITERIDAFWMCGLLVLVWVVLRVMSAQPQSMLDHFKNHSYELFVVGLLTCALVLPLVFNVKYELTSIFAQQTLEEMRSIEMPDNDPCFYTIVEANASTLGNTFYAHEEYDKECAAIEVAEMIINSGLEHEDVVLAASGILTLSELSDTYNRAAEKIRNLLQLAIRSRSEVCIEDQNYALCLRPVDAPPPLTSSNPKGQ